MGITGTLQGCCMHSSTAGNAISRGPQKAVNHPSPDYHIITIEYLMCHNVAATRSQPRPKPRGLCAEKRSA